MPHVHPLVAAAARPILLAAIVWLGIAVSWLVPIGAAALCLLGRMDARRVRRVTEQRRGESICTFVRSFERRTVDPWVLRATYEALAAWSGHPIRSGDHLEQVLLVADEDLSLIVADICRRALRRLDDTEANRSAKFATVRDLVLFIDRQPGFDEPAATPPR